MKHTKNILKSLLITVMALSLLAVSCSKDEGGSKPTNPAPTKLEVAKQAVAEAAKKVTAAKAAAAAETAAVATTQAASVKTEADNVEKAVTTLEGKVNELKTALEK